MKICKIILQINIALVLSLTTHVASADTFETDYDQEIYKLNIKLKALESERDAAKKAIKDSAWYVDTYLGVEQEIDSDDNGKFINGSMATSPYFGAFIYQNNSLWMYDVQILKTYLDHNSEYDRTRWQVGATRTFPFTLAEHKGNAKLRLGYRNDNWHYPSISNPALSAPSYMGDVRKGEERHEIWIRPQLNYTLNPNVSLNASLSFRLID